MWQSDIEIEHYIPLRVTTFEVPWHRTSVRVGLIHMYAPHRLIRLLCTYAAGMNPALNRSSVPQHFINEVTQ